MDIKFSVFVSVQNVSAKCRKLIVEETVLRSQFNNAWLSVYKMRYLQSRFAR